MSHDAHRWPMRTPAREMHKTLGPDFASHPSEWWGSEDWAAAATHNRPLNQTLPPPAPDRTIPPGFSLFPGRGVRESAGDRALREIRNAKAARALRKLGHRR
jgi:hypothetical protein